MKPDKSLFIVSSQGQVCGLQGGFDDRQKLRRAEIDRNRELKKQAEVDDLVLEPRRMAEAGEGLESIVSAMQRLGSPIPEADVQAILDDVKDQERRRAELRSEGISTASDPQVFPRAWLENPRGFPCQRGACCLSALHGFLRKAASHLQHLLCCRGPCTCKTPFCAIAGVNVHGPLQGGCLTKTPLSQGL